MKENESEFRIVAIASHPITGGIVALKNESKFVFPILIGDLEAVGIAMFMSGQKIERPLTYDLLMTFVNELNAEIKKVVITKLENNTYFSEIHVKTENGEMKVIDSRPSDAINVALRVNLPILASDSLIESLKKDEDERIFDELLYEIPDDQKPC